MRYRYKQTKNIKSDEELWDTRLGPGMPSYTKKDKQLNGNR